VFHITSFLRTNPHFFVSLEVHASDEVIRSVLDGWFDLGLTGVKLHRDGVTLLPYRAFRLIFLVNNCVSL